MKAVIIVRHAKSNKDDLFMKDLERPLNKRGKKNAPEMAKRLRDKKVEIDAFFSSPAVRAFTTAEYFAKEYDVKKNNIITKERLYNDEPEVFYKTIAEADDAYKTIALFSHNPGATDFINLLTETHIDNLPTCGVFAVKADIKSWKDFKKAAKEFWFFDYPKSDD